MCLTVISMFLFNALLLIKSYNELVTTMEQTWPQFPPAFVLPEL